NFYAERRHMTTAAAEEEHSPGPAVPSAQASPSSSPFDDEDLNDAVWIKDDEEWDRVEREEEEDRGDHPRPHQHHPHTSPRRPRFSAPTAHPHLGLSESRDLLSAFHRVLEEVERSRS